MTADFRALCVELTDCLEKADWPLRHRYVFRQWIDIARAALAGEPAVPEVVGSEWQPCVKLPITVHVREQRPGEQHVSTREGITPVQPDDLIMLGVDGEEYPIGRELFQRTYRMGSADEPAVPEGREPAAVTKQPSDAEQVLRLAAIIREVDGNHSKGAAALAESILDHPGFRAVLAHWGNHVPAPPADGEVAELAAALRNDAINCTCSTLTSADLRRAAELLQRQVLPEVDK